MLIFFSGFCVSMFFLSFHRFDTGMEYNKSLFFHNLGSFSAFSIPFLIFSAINCHVKKIKKDFPVLLGVFMLGALALTMRFSGNDQPSIVIVYSLLVALVGFTSYWTSIKLIRNSFLIVFVIAISFLSTISLARESILPKLELQSLKKAIEKDELLSVISRDFPNEYKILISESKKSLADGGGSEYTVWKAAAFFNQIFPCYLRKSPDNLIFDFLTSTINNYEILYRKNPKLCLQAIDPLKYGTLPSMDEPNILAMSNNRAVKIRIIESRENRFNSNAERIEAEKYFFSVLQNLYQKFGVNPVNSALNIDENSILSESQHAKIIIDYLKGIRALGFEKSGILARYLYAAQCYQKN